MGIVPEDEIVEHTSNTSNTNNGEDYDNLNPPTILGTKARRGENEGYNSWSSCENSSHRSLVHNQGSTH